MDSSYMCAVHCMAHSSQSFHKTSNSHSYSTSGTGPVRQSLFCIKRLAVYNVYPRESFWTSRHPSTFPSMASENKQVCVTGAAGFIGTHLCRELLKRGYKVRATVRNADDDEKCSVLKHLHEDIDGAEPLELISANLNDPSAFDEPFKGCVGIFHVASVVMMTAKNAQRDIVDPAVNGTKNVFASIDRVGGVKTVVLVSSIAAIEHTSMAKLKENPDYVWTEEDWNIDATVKTNPYGLSKKLAEEAAWDAYKATPEDKRYRLIVVNPGLVLGPVSTKAHCKTSVDIVENLLSRKFPAIPAFSFPTVHVFDVVDAMVKGYEDESVESGRHILVNGTLPLIEMARMMAKAYPKPQFRVPTGRLPNFLVYVGALFDSRMSFAFLRANLDRVDNFSNEKAKEKLGIEFRSLEDCVLDTCKSLVENGFVKPRK